MPFDDEIQGRLRELERGLAEMRHFSQDFQTERYNMAHIGRVIQDERIPQLAQDILRLDKRISAMEAQVAPLMELLKEALRGTARKTEY
jgi:hypothetical protein